SKRSIAQHDTIFTDSSRDRRIDERKLSTEYLPGPNDHRAQSTVAHRVRDELLRFELGAGVRSTPLWKLFERRRLRYCGTSALARPVDNRHRADVDELLDAVLEASVDNVLRPDDRRRAVRRPRSRHRRAGVNDDARTTHGPLDR